MPVLRRCFGSFPALQAELLVKVPQMAESINEGTLSTFLKQVGDRVEADDELASIETDKIDVAVNAPEGGVVVELLVEEGAVVTVDQPIARIDTAVAVVEGTGAASAKGQTQPESEPITASSASKEESPLPSLMYEKPPRDPAPQAGRAKPAAPVKLAPTPTPSNNQASTQSSSLNTQTSSGQRGPSRAEREVSKGHTTLRNFN